ncbi:isocitrate lyase/phosphoenolpyruvate mutase family protein [Shewanella sp. Choline-02u-19]|uniref:isocitrate lyase/PEP mutase family protein n=1 Tax=unclassified Shewanella TaxID=196818 RepID=UPI000C3251F8|nr:MULTISPECIES: isocitrate lyase/phosphoenolpyruvate mutase family protein [unclassified Shewanella]PKH54993.1 isocitrate lyase/phosphoenolpyruvate mutase family protein [Shewanella sp. Bg11-22]PKI26765.1 isocitrate lyase/phosphoenolpyruvate mutase family protein [Shewanella sp. Choline-02u-19]
MFKDLHRKELPLLICNVWDVSSSLIAERNGFSAIGTSSAAIAKMLGKEDGEHVLFEELLSIVTAISNLSSLPLTVDIESGYGDSSEVIAENIIELAKVGVVGVNIEDSTVVQGERLLCDEIEFANKLKSVKAILNQMNITMFVNVRSDTYLLNIEDALEVSIDRIALYQRAGADGIFLPCLKFPNDIRAVVASTELPINVMCVPDLPDFEMLERLGVKRISMGNFLHEAMLDSFSSMLSSIVSEKSFGQLFK